MSGTDKISLCDPYVWEDPRYLFRSTWLDRYLSRSAGVCASELINRIVFFYLFGMTIGYIVSCFTNITTAVSISGILTTVILIPTFMKLREVHTFREETKKVEEGFSEDWTNTNQIGVAPSSSSTHNPFQNVLVDEIKYAPTRSAAPDITNIDRKIELDEYFRVQWYSDPTDVFGKSQSQRQFITQPSTTIPNDQGSYQDWLYKIPGKTCKEGNPDACYGGTNGGPLPWLN